MSTVVRYARVVVLTLALCTAAAVYASVQSERSDEDNLTRKFAATRRAQVKKVDYDLSFTLVKGADGFSGRAILDVELAETDRPLSIDLLANTISKLTVNGRPVTNFVQRKGSFDIPGEALAPKSRIEVVYAADYSKDGSGFQHSVDPEDKQEYLFSDFEPAYAHGLFPCFDQPDLKATFRVTVDAPSDWKVISNYLPENSKELSTARTLTRFKQTPPISTYLFFLGAGPYAEWSDNRGKVPIYIWARKSLAKYVDADRLFSTSQKGLKFYGDYFGYQYPFEKFGLIFIPEFAWGGMENPGAIAVNESEIFRGPVTNSKMEGRDGLILHEMAHMWFGDLVTMKWWNDLWLNESFATYAATLAQDRALGSKVAWLGFASEKTWGYWQDQLVTSHPIETEVFDVRTAKGNFDGITYAKGGASLKQLHFYVGDESFRAGLRGYFRKYAFNNTTRPDFTAEISRASKKNLNVWTRDWLQTSGPNRVETKWSCSASKIKTFAIEQAPSASKTLSPHRVRIGLFKASGDALNLFQTADVNYSTLSTPVRELLGAPCPDFVFPNLDDQDYALFALDRISVRKAETAISGGISQPLSRLMIWNTLDQMVRDSELPIGDYMKFAVSGLKNETNENVLAIVMGHHSALAHDYFHYLDNVTRATLAPALEEVVWNRARSAEAGSNLQMTFFDFYTSIAQTAGAMENLRGFLRGIGVPAGMTIDQDRRWSIISSLASRGAKGSPELIDAEEKRDTTTAGRRSAFVARGAIPSAEAKKTYWSRFQQPEKIPFSSLRLASQSFNNPNDVELSQPFVKPFFADVTKMDWSANDNLVEIYFKNLFPQNLCSKSLLVESKKNLLRTKGLTALARRAWLEANDELSKCLSVRATAAAQRESQPIR